MSHGASRCRTAHIYSVKPYALFSFCAFALLQQETGVHFSLYTAEEVQTSHIKVEIHGNFSLTAQMHIK